MRNLITVILLVSVTSIFAQKGFKLGLHGALPIAENNKVVGLVVGADAGYLYPLGKVVDLGAMVGFINGFPEKFHKDEVLYDLPNVQFMPVAVSARIWPGRGWSFGIDGGYALGINKDNPGGAYFKPILGILLGPQTEINFSYTGIQDKDDPWATVNLGVLYTFPTRIR